MPPADRDHDQAPTTAVQSDLFGAAGVVVRHCPMLRFADSAGAHEVVLENPRAVLGSAPGVDVVVADRAVSRLHCEFELRDGGALWVRDLGSTNGTYVEGLQVGSARLSEGARVRVGGTEITVAYDPLPSPVEQWPEERFGPLLGRSAVMRELFARLARVAESDATVLVQGETGTGKELVAQALHAASRRAEGPFVVVDCASLPENLLEAELFGHARGAFTGAVTARAGAIEAADGGTVFLDEVGELPLALQPKLLRAIESRTVRRLGEAGARRLDVRFVSATHRDLRAMVNQGTFREDLYFRLAVVPVAVPPLRARPEDIPLLVEHFAGAPPHPTLLAPLAARPWPGNVRELRNFVDRVRALGPREALAALEPSDEPAVGTPSVLPPPPAAARASAVPPPPPPAAFAASPAPPAVSLPPALLGLSISEARDRWVADFERAYIRALLARHNNNVTAAAAAAGIHRGQLHRLIKKNGL